MGGGAAGTTGILWVEARDAARYPIMRKAGPTQRITWPQMSTVLTLRNSHLDENAQERVG